MEDPTSPTPMTGLDSSFAAGFAVGDCLDALAAGLGVSVPSFCGLQMLIVRSGFPLTVTTRAAAATVGAHAAPVGPAAHSSLRLPLRMLGLDVETGSQVVIYAGVAGALVDLAADATYACARDLPGGSDPTGGAGHPTAAAEEDGQGVIVLDADLPQPCADTGLSGLDELMTVVRAQGMMIQRGHHPDDVDATFRRQAVAAGLDPLAFALDVLAA